MRCVLAVALLILLGCSSAPEPAAKTESPPAAASVRDLSGLLPAAGLIGAKVVSDHLLDQPKMPGGTVGEYNVRGKKYQLFIIDAENGQKAAFLLVDMKSALKDPEYLSHMGGYFGSDGMKPVFVFAKLQYLAGVVGLPKDEADPIARVLAARLR